MGSSGLPLPRLSTRKQGVAAVVIWEKLFRRLHYAAGEVRSYTLYFPMHRKSDGQRFAQFRVSSPELCVAVKVVTVCAGPHPSHARPPSDTPGGPGPAAAAARPAGPGTVTPGRTYPWSLTTQLPART